MRDTKFRARSLKNFWQKDEAKWVYGDIARTWDYGAQGSVHIDYTIHTSSQYDRPIKVNGETVGQFSGLKDKNEKEIYEGDILNTEFGIYVVEFNDGCFWACRVEDEDNVPLYVHCDEETPLLCEVIGNIHTDKKLLKK